MAGRDGGSLRPQPRSRPDLLEPGERRGYTRGRIRPLRPMDRPPGQLRASRSVRSGLWPREPPETMPLISSLGAMLRTSVRRSRADWPIVASAGLICVLAATLLAAGSIFAGAVSIAGLHRVLVDAPPAAGGIAVSSWVQSDRPMRPTRRPRRRSRGRFGPVGGRIDRLATTDSFALPDQPGGDRARARRARLRGGARRPRHHRRRRVAGRRWRPTDRPSRSRSAGRSPRRWGCRSASGSSWRARIQPGSFAPVQIAGVFGIDDPTEHYWWADAQVLEGVVTSGSFVTHGPFFTTKEALVASAPRGLVQLTWHAFPDAGAVTLADVAGLRTRTADLRGRLDASMPGPRERDDRPAGHPGDGRTIPAGEPDRCRAPVRPARRPRGLRGAAQRVAADRAPAGRQRAAPLTRGGDEADRRRWRSSRACSSRSRLRCWPRGSPWPPWGHSTWSDRSRTIGLSIAPSVTADAYVAAAVAAGICLVALTLPGVLARGPTRCPSRAGRAGETRGIGRRLGIDIALLAIAGLGLVAAPPLRRAADALHPGDDRARSAAGRCPGDRPARGCALRAPDHPARSPSSSSEPRPAAAGSCRRSAPASSPAVPCATRARRCC